MSRELQEFFAALDESSLGALIETMVLAGDADGGLEEGELRALVRELSGLVSGTALASYADGPTLGPRIDAARATLERDGREAFVASVTARLGSDEAREGALALAARIVASDGIVRTSEREVLLELAEGLGIDVDRAADLVREQTTATPR